MWVQAVKADCDAKPQHMLIIFFAPEEINNSLVSRRLEKHVLNVSQTSFDTNQFHGSNLYLLEMTW